MSIWSASPLLFLLHGFCHCDGGCITFTPSELTLDAPIYHGVYATTASNDLYILGGTTLDTDENEQPLSEFYVWNGRKPNILNHLSNVAGPSSSISEIYSTEHNHFACLSGTCAVAMPNDIIYIIGVNYFDPTGYNLQYIPNKVLTFDAGIGQFVPNAIQLPYATTQGCVAADQENQMVFYIGGYDQHGKTTGYVQLISLQRNHQATLLTLLPSDVTVAGAHCVYHQQYLWIFGGYGDDGIQYKTIWSYNMGTLTGTWAHSLQELSHGMTAATIVAPDDMIYIIGEQGLIDVFEPSTARIVRRYSELPIDRFAVAAVGVSSVSATASETEHVANRWQLWIFGGLTSMQNGSGFLALDSVEVAVFPDADAANYQTTTFYPTPTGTNISPQLQRSKITFQQPPWIWLVIMIALAAMVVVICVMLSCMLYYRGREKEDQEQRAQRRKAFKQYRNSSGTQSSQGHHANIKTTSLDLDDNEHLEMISLALRNEQMHGHKASAPEKEYSEGAAITHFE